MKENNILNKLIENEFKIFEGTSHPNIMRVFELLNDEKYYYVVSEFIEYGELFDLFS